MDERGTGEPGRSDEPDAPGGGSDRPGVGEPGGPGGGGPGALDGPGVGGPGEPDGPGSGGSRGRDRPGGGGSDVRASGSTVRDRRTGREHWSWFRSSPFFPAAVLLLILAAAAGLFAGSYTYAMANPTPHRVPTAVVGVDDGTPRGRAFVAGMEKALNTSLELHRYASYERAERAVDEQDVFAVLRVRGRGMELDVSGASGAQVAQVLSQAAPKVGKAVGVPVTVRDIKPLQDGDPRGLAIFYISLAAVIVGFIGAIQLSVHASGLNPAERTAFILANAVLGSFSIAAVVDWGLGAVDLPFVESWSILALTMFTSGMVFTMFNTLIGRWAMLPTWGLMVLLGNPSSGGAVSWPLLPSLLGHIGRWLPPGASVNAQHTAVYFGGHQHPFPFLVLAGWALLATAVFWTLRHRHPGGRPIAPVAAG